MRIDRSTVMAFLVATATIACEPAGVDDDPVEDDLEFELCDPTLAEFDGDVVPQAGVEIDLTDDACAAVSGPPPSDQLVIDDFGDTFGGSGSGLRVASMSAGEFTNEDGFFLLDALPVDEPIVIEFEPSATTPELAVQLTIAADGSAITDTAVRVGR